MRRRWIAPTPALIPATPNSHVAILAKTYGVPFGWSSDAGLRQALPTWSGREVIVRMDEARRSVSVLDVTGPDGLPTANKLTLPDRYCLSTNTNLTLTEANIGKVLPINGVAFRLDLRIVQPLYTFGKLLAARDLGRVGVDMARASADATRADLGLNLARAYYGLKSLRAALITVREGNEQIQAWVKRIDKDMTGLALNTPSDIEAFLKTA